MTNYRETSMMDFLFTLGQGFCIWGLLYGAYLAITHAPAEGSFSARVNYDPLTTHVWDTPNQTLEQRTRRVTA